MNVTTWHENISLNIDMISGSKIEFRIMLDEQVMG